MISRSDQSKLVDSIIKRADSNIDELVSLLENKTRKKFYEKLRSGKFIELFWVGTNVVEDILRKFGTLKKLQKMLPDGVTARVGDPRGTGGFGKDVLLITVDTSKFKGISEKVDMNKFKKFKSKMIDILEKANSPIELKKALDKVKFQLEDTDF